MITHHEGPYEIAPGLYQLGNSSVPCFLLDAPQPALFDAGFACLTQSYLDDARHILGERTPAWLFLSHVHFDHCGAAGWLKEAWPEMRIVAAPKSAKIITRPNALKLIAQLNQAAAQNYFTSGGTRRSPHEFKPFTLDGTVDDGDEIDLGGGIKVRVLATPGHTWDSLSFYIPGKRILFASEAVGTDAPGSYIVSEFLVSFDAYVESLYRLGELEVETLCPGHHAVHTGPAAKKHIGRGVASAEQFREWVLRLLAQEEGDQERVVELVRMGEYDHRPGPKQPLPAYMLNLQARVATLAREAGYTV
ncbi:MAG: MBL fold metallo-hydrolase [Proteobacteria bacterium]|nr:MBL fold metallo-hydrolase [Pseudomonadota bacterium]MBU4381822.1 MBL fold metallo-hydrolase [Pseudomonadota bacterium]MCG2765778.1 MBL fold metallo-hydrolase [Desulfarculaceae bacterium]